MEKIITKSTCSHLQSNNNQHEDLKYKFGQTNLMAFFYGLTDLEDQGEVI